ncbi:DUF3784 domain-containing protein [Vagococcus intermedius]|uniref:DUF3784 domain-containing protein n=1 Tax=Vagococcus intermedius TaxID=2991418 RepID=A0AAF0I929_9ENTE|nr:DUF3784 domain-containing protein [Vagococcus intermedius]WEG73082.1 DUF3784 domain-containing protein [Vagococcus intermedius]WEG75166.1 DUF3784 domain-containing protein [Vagococcus intermedius]
MIFNVIIFFLMMLLSVLCFVCSDKFSKGQWLHLIAGYNHLSPKQKDNVNTKKIFQNASKVSLVAGVYIFYLSIVLQFILQDLFAPFFDLLLIGIPTITFFFYVILKVKDSKKNG